MNLEFSYTAYVVVSIEHVVSACVGVGDDGAVKEAEGCDDGTFTCGFEDGSGEVDMRVDAGTALGDEDVDSTEDAGEDDGEGEKDCSDWEWEDAVSTTFDCKECKCAVSRCEKDEREYG